jgi:hypothetical protein
MQEAFENQRLPVYGTVAVFFPEHQVMGHVNLKECLERIVMPVEMIIGKDFRETFLIVVVCVPQRVIKVKEDGFVSCVHPTSITKYLPRLQNNSGSKITMVKFPF